MPILSDTVISGCREQNFVWILIRHARLLVAASHSSMTNRSLSLVAKRQLQRPHRRDWKTLFRTLRGSERTRIQTDLVHPRTRMYVTALTLITDAPTG